MIARARAAPRTPWLRQRRRGPAASARSPWPRARRALPQRRSAEWVDRAIPYESSSSPQRQEIRQAVAHVAPGDEQLAAAHQIFVDQDSFAGQSVAAITLRDLGRRLALAPLQRHPNPQADDPRDHEVPFAGEPKRCLNVHLRVSHGSLAQLDQRALGMQAGEPETEAIGPRGIDRQLEPATRRVVALGPDQHLDRGAEGVGVSRRSGGQRCLDFIGRLGRRLAAQQALRRRMDVGDRVVAGMTGSALLEARQTVVDQVAKRKLEAGQGQSLGLELQRPLRVRRQPS